MKTTEVMLEKNRLNELKFFVKQFNIWTEARSSIQKNLDTSKQIVKTQIEKYTKKINLVLDTIHRACLDTDRKYEDVILYCVVNSISFTEYCRDVYSDDLDKNTYTKCLTMFWTLLNEVKE